MASIFRIRVLKELLIYGQHRKETHTPCGLYSYTLNTPSSSPVTIASSPSVKKKSALMTQTQLISFARRVSLYGSSCSCVCGVNVL